MSKFCLVMGCRKQVTSDARSHGVKLCGPHFDEWFDQQDWTEKHQCTEPAELTMADATLGYSVCSCGNHIPVHDEDRRRVITEWAEKLQEKFDA